VNTVELQRVEAPPLANPSSRTPTPPSPTEADTFLRPWCQKGAAPSGYRVNEQVSQFDDGHRNDFRKNLSDMRSRTMVVQSLIYWALSDGTLVEALRSIFGF
jgi:hypothetical protein